LVLTPKISRVLWAWWVALHALLAAAVALVAAPEAIKVLAMIAIVGHGVVRRPRGRPRLVVVTADGFCAVPDWGTGRRPIGSRTLLCPFWVKLDLGRGLRRRDILLIADQVPPEDWRRLRALLARTRGD
jgi:hypothetical protein